MRTRSLAVGVVLAACLGAPLLRCAEDKPPAPAPPETTTSPLSPSGMLRFPGGKVRLGMSRKDLKDLISKTELGRMANQEKNIEDEYSLSCPEYEAVVPPFWIGKYEVTNAQYHRFLDAFRVAVVVPAKGKPGPTTLEQIARLHLLAEPLPISGPERYYYPCANDWKALYEINEEALNPVVKDQDPKTRPAPETFRTRDLPPGTKILTNRWSVPLTWRVKGRLQTSPPPGMEEMPVSMVSLADAEACAEYYGCHILKEQEWEAACRGPKGEIWPEGGEALDPLGHNWKGFNLAVQKSQEEAKKKVEDARKRFEEAKVRGIPSDIAAARSVYERLRFTVDAREIPEDPPYTIVGMFPLGRSPCGAMDMIGNVEEWVSTPLGPYPGTDSRSDYLHADAFILRGANAIDRDSVLTATFRKFKNGNIFIGRHFKAASAGFRMARYEAPGASEASTVERHLYGQDGRAAILPREDALKPRRKVGPRLDISRAAGMARYNEVPWNAAGSPKSDPPGKVFHLGAAESFCVVPADGIPFRDPGAIVTSAKKNPVPPKDEKGPPETRQPRDIPFFGVVHMTGAVKLKGQIRIQKEFDEPLTEADRKLIKEAWEREMKRQEEEKKKKEEEEKKGGGAGGIQQALEGGDKEKKGGKKDGDKPKDGEKPEEEAKPEDEEEKPEDGKGPVYPRTKKVVKDVYEPGFVDEKVAPNGLLLGLFRHGEETRAVLWEARQGTVSTSPAPPCSTVMLEPPLVILDKGAIDFKKVGKAGDPVSILREQEGELDVTFYVPVEGKEGSGFIQVLLKVKLDFTTATAGRPWVTMPEKPK